MIESASSSSTHDPQRRAALVIAATGPAAAFGATSAPERRREVRTFSIECPKSGLITSVFSSKSHVAKGDLLCEIEVDDELRAMAHVNLAAKLLQLESKLLDPTQISIRRSILEQGAKVAQQNEQITLRILTATKTRFSTGVATQSDIDTMEMAYIRSQAENLKAQASLQLFDFNISQAQSRLALYLEQIPHEVDFVKAKINRLKVYSPTSGELKLFFLERSFVKLGHVIATITG